MSTGEIIKKLRLERKLTQQQLAEAVTIDIRRISLYENEKMMPSTDVLQRLAHYFYVSTDYLLAGEPEGIRRTSFRDGELFELFQEADRLVASDKEVIKEVIRAFIFKNRIKNLTDLQHS